MTQLSPQDIESFSKLTKEIEVKLPDGKKLWVVPSKTGKRRREITPDELAQIGKVTELFPGSKISGFVPNEEIEDIEPGTFRNNHLSVSRAQSWEQCPQKFALSYIYKMEREPAGDALYFGSLCHDTLEQLVKEHVESENDGPLDVERAEAIYEHKWSRTPLSGVELFGEGLEIIRRTVQDIGPLDAWDVLAVEDGFEIEVDGHLIIGFFDRVDRIDDETIEVIDYKTNRSLFGRYDLDHELQLSVYKAAAKRKWPWAKKVRLTYHMLRHGIRQSVERTDEQAEAALRYLAAIGTQTETATDYPPKMGPLCGWCGVKAHCLAYQRALNDRSEVATELPEVLEDVCQEREALAAQIKILSSRKSELEKLIRPHLKDGDAVEAGGVRYSLYRTTTVNYPLDETLEQIWMLGKVDRFEAGKAIAVVDKKALAAFIKGLELDRPTKALLKAELEAVAKKTFGTRFAAKQLKERKLDA